MVWYNVFFKRMPLVLDTYFGIYLILQIVISKYYLSVGLGLVVKAQRRARIINGLCVSDIDLALAQRNRDRKNSRVSVECISGSRQFAENGR